MPERKRKIKKIVFIYIPFFVIVILGIVFYFGFGNNIKNIYIKGNIYLTDQEIIELAKLENYPNFYTTTSSSIKKRIKMNPYIKEVKVEKKFFLVLKITIEEYKPLFIKDENKTIVFENKEEMIPKTDDITLPILVNHVPEEKYDLLVNRYARLGNEIIFKISEIKYDPNKIDEDRFLLYMNDENYVYVTLTKLELLNKYNEAVTKLEGKKGILYLDSGSYFEIKN